MADPEYGVLQCRYVALRDAVLGSIAGPERHNQLRLFKIAAYKALNCYLDWCSNND
jgi:hypothetical protein